MAGINNLTPFTKDDDRASKAGIKGGSNKKGSVHINTHVQELMSDPTFDAWISDPREGIKKFEGVPIKAIIKAQMIKAINGDTKAFDSLVKAGWSQKIEQENTGDMKIEVVTRHAGSKQLTDAD